MKKCFVVSPIGEEGSEFRKRADQVYKYIISPVCEKCGFEAIRSDQINRADSIPQTIIDNLKSAELVIADMTGHNPNVFYEMGFRACTQKPMIHIREKTETIPADIAGIRAFDYCLTDLDAVEEVKDRLERTIQSFNIGPDNSQDDGTSEDHEIKSQKMYDSQILPVLYSIQDQLNQLRSEIHNKDTETIQAIVRTMQSTIPPEDPQTTLIKTLLPEILRNPNSAKTLMELGNMTKKE